MKVMKIIIVFALICVLCLSACGKESTNSTGDNVITLTPKKNESSSSVKESNQSGSNESSSSVPADPQGSDTPAPSSEISYTIYAPSNYKVTVNGAEVSADTLVASVDFTELAECAKLVSMPKVNQYLVNVPTENPEIKIYDKDGNEQNVRPNGQNAYYCALAYKGGAVPDDVKTRSLEMAKTWQSFLVRDLTGTGYGLATVQAVLVKDSDYYNQAQAYSKSVDITFISDHKSNGYAAENVTDYIEYGPDCYSVRVQVTKKLHLNRTGENITDTFDSILFFVNVDDTDDGADNPHWAIADMQSFIGKTEYFPESLLAEKPEEVYDANGICMKEIAGHSFYGKLMIVKDPSKVKVASVGKSGSWPKTGKNLDAIVIQSGAIAGINGGMYIATSNSGGTPRGVVVENGVVTFNVPEGNAGMQMIGFDEDNRLQVKDLKGISAKQFAEYAKEARIRDAVSFQEEEHDANNHFVGIMSDGVKRDMGVYGKGLNPKTVIGQRADGTVLMLVTDGRGANGHLGASAADIQAIMEQYGAAFAANIDCGSSSAMYAGGAYEMTSVTFYYKKGSWNMPTAFVVTK
ncbi:MAG: phosphodiester glycosidase family protein [Lachnospiraceae bacterium]|nr:phosphodiester glycosidase family protein [Lachnospiraceae bacterium]